MRNFIALMVFYYLFFVMILGFYYHLPPFFCIILGLSLFISGIISFLSDAWVGFMVILVFSGGLLVLFTFFLSAYPRPPSAKFSIQEIAIMKFYLWAIFLIFFFSSFYNQKELEDPSSTFYQKEDQQAYVFSELVLTSQSCIILLLFLFVGLIAANKICKLKMGPLR